MQTFQLLTFDDILFGTGSTWYTPAEHSAVIGRADFLAFQARTTHVSGSSPTLTVRAEHSPDGRIWAAIQGAAEISSTIADEKTLFGTVFVFFAAHVRCRISLGGTNPACRVKIYAAGRHAGG